MSIYTDRRNFMEEKIRIVFRVIGKLTQTKGAIMLLQYETPSVLYAVVFTKEATFYIFVCW